MGELMKKIILVGSNSIHCKRYIAGMLSTHKYQVMIITNQHMSEFIDTPQVIVDFSLRNLTAYKTIRQSLQKFIPDIVHIQQANSYAWHTFRALKKLIFKPKTILTTWGSDVLLLPKQNKLMHKMVVSNLCSADVITSDSLFMSAEVAKLIAPINKPIKTINFGIQYLPSKQDVNQKEKIILSNRLHKSLYRIDAIIHAFAKLCATDRIDGEYKLVVAANGSESDVLHKLVHKLDIASRVQFTGMLSYDELISYYQKANVFVSVPESDGTASSLLESMAYGCVPVLSNLPANLEWVLNEVNGVIAEDMTSLDERILMAIQMTQNSQHYHKIYEFNYSLIQDKAIFANNLQKFINLYN